MNDTTTSTNDRRVLLAMAHAEVRRFTETLEDLHRLLDAGLIGMEQALDIISAHCAAAKIVIHHISKPRRDVP